MPFTNASICYTNAGSPNLHTCIHVQLLAAFPPTSNDNYLYLYVLSILSYLSFVGTFPRRLAVGIAQVTVFELQHGAP